MRRDNSPLRANPPSALRQSSVGDDFVLQTVRQGDDAGIVLLVARNAVPSARFFTASSARIFFLKTTPRSRPAPPAASAKLRRCGLLIFDPAQQLAAVHVNAQLLQIVPEHHADGIAHLGFVVVRNTFVPSANSGAARLVEKITASKVVFINQFLEQTFCGLKHRLQFGFYTIFPPPRSKCFPLLNRSGYNGSNLFQLNATFKK